MRTNEASVERIAIVAMAALTLAPLFFHSFWLLIAVRLGLPVQAAALSVGSILVVGGLVAGHVWVRRRTRMWAILLATGVGACMAAFLCTDFPSWLAITGAFLLLALVETLLWATLSPRLPKDLDGKAAQYKLRTGLLVLVACFSLVQTARLSAFMADAHRTEHSMLPEIAFFKSHSCLTAYVHAVHLVQSGEKNIYDERLWPDEAALGTKRELGPDSTGPYAPF